MARYQVELVGGRHAPAIYEVMDTAARPPRALCAATKDDADKIVEALNAREERGTEGGARES